jgi:O-antigen/teichoic acid export membrane protein
MIGAAASVFITARYLGPQGRGVVAAATSWVALIATLGSFSVGQVAIHYASQNRHREWLPEVAGGALVVVLGAAAVGWSGMAALFAFSDGRFMNNVPPAAAAVAFVSLPLLLWNDISRNILFALGAVSITNVSTVTASIVSVGAVVLLIVALGGDVLSALVCAIVSNTVVAVIHGRTIWQRAGRLQVDWRTARTLLGRGVQLHLNAVGTFLFAQASVLVLNYYRSAAEVGYYQLAIQLLNFMLVFATSIGAVSYGTVARRGPDAAWAEQRLLVAHSLWLSALIAAVAMLVAPIAIPLVAGESFRPTVGLFRAIAFALVGATFSSVMASQWIGRGMFWQTGVLTCAVGLISLLCDLAFIPRYGMRGAVISTLVTYGISVIGNGAMAVWVERKWRHLMAHKGTSDAPAPMAQLPKNA